MNCRSVTKSNRRKFLQRRIGKPWKIGIFVKLSSCKERVATKGLYTTRLFALKFLYTKAYCRFKPLLERHHLMIHHATVFSGANLKNFRALKIVIFHLCAKNSRVVCPNFGHPALTSSFTKYEFLQVKNSFATILNELSVFKLLQLSNGDFIIFVACLQHLQRA